MSLSTLQLHPDRSLSVLLRATIRGDLAAAVAAARDSGVPAFCLIADSDVPVLDALGEDLLRVIRPRQVEHVAQSTRHRRAVLVTCPFTSAKRGLQSLRAYRAQCVSSNGWAVVFISLPAQLFAELRREAIDPTPAERRLLGLDATVRWESASGVHIHEPVDAGWDIGDEIVPQSLRDAYLGDSFAARRVRHRVMCAAKSNLPVIVIGENGTGKEIVARQIHANSDRRAVKLVTLNVTCIPDALFESVMFGHKKGSFTGAISDQTGCFEKADNGTLFLDEAGDLPPEAQAKLLRAFAEGEIQVLGGAVIRVNTRIIIATNKDLFRMVDTGEFRLDLFERVHGYVIRTPSLRSCPEDIALIARSYWRKYVERGARPLSGAMISALQEQPWKGNVRELRMRLDVLFEVFGHSDVSPLHLDALLASEEGEILGLGLGRHQSAEAMWLEHLDHVCAAMEVIRSAQLPMRGPIRQGKVDPVTLGRVIIQLRHASAKLESLCTSPAPFHYDKAFSAAREFKNVAAEVSQLLVTDPAMGLRKWVSEGEPLSEHARRLLFIAMRKIELLLGKRQPLRKSRAKNRHRSVNPPGALS